MFVCVCVWQNNDHNNILNFYNVCIPMVGLFFWCKTVNENYHNYATFYYLQSNKQSNILYEKEKWFCDLLPSSSFIQQKIKKNFFDKFFIGSLRHLMCVCVGDASLWVSKWWLCDYFLFFFLLLPFKDKCCVCRMIYLKLLCVIWHLNCVRDEFIRIL